MDLVRVDLSPPEGHQLVLGQAHFIKTVEDICETLATAIPGAKFGVSFCEASGDALIRYDGTDAGCVEFSKKCAAMIGAGHCFVVVLREAYPINVLARLKAVEEVVSLYCATSNPVTVVVADTGEGRAILGVADGTKPKGEESESGKAQRRELLRKIGYKF